MSSALPNRLALGTAQFGLDYGIANAGGRVSDAEVGAILDGAKRAGLDTLDTAAAYGDSEARLGEIGIDGWRVVTKLPPLRGAGASVSEWVVESVRSSLARLRCSSITGLLLHRADHLSTADGDALYGAMRALRDDGIVQKIGVSVYGPEELNALWSRYRFDLVQVPFNVLDRRLAVSGWLERLAGDGVEVHTRSAFLQGLLLMPAAERPPQFRHWDALWDAWDAWLAAERISALQATLGFALAHAAIARVVVGMDSAAHLDQIVAASATDVPEPPPFIATDDPMLINPSNWSRL